MRSMFPNVSKRHALGRGGERKEEEDAKARARALNTTGWVTLVQCGLNGDQCIVKILRPDGVIFVDDFDALTQNVPRSFSCLLRKLMVF